MAIQSDIDFVVLFLKIAPFALTFALGVLQRDFHSEWTSSANDYFEVTDPDWGSLQREDIEGRYKHLTIYTNDKELTRYILTLVFLYALLLHLLSLYQTRNWLLLIPSVGFIFLLLGSWFGLERWFTITEEGRNPDRYYKHYYKKREGRRIRQYYINHLLPPSVDRKISPMNIVLASEFLLFISVLGLELTSGVTAVAISIVIIIVIVFMGYLVWPGIPYFKDQEE